MSDKIKLTEEKEIVDVDFEETVPGKSPVPEKTGPEVVDFFDALFAVADGSKITKLEWGNVEIYGLLREAKLQLHKDDGKFYDWIVTDGDLAGKDWTIL